MHIKDQLLKLSYSFTNWPYYRRHSASLRLVGKQRYTGQPLPTLVKEFHDRKIAQYYID